MDPKTFRMPTLNSVAQKWLHFTSSTVISFESKKNNDDDDDPEDDTPCKNGKSKAASAKKKKEAKHKRRATTKIMLMMRMMRAALGTCRYCPATPSKCHSVVVTTRTFRYFIWCLCN